MQACEIPMKSLQIKRMYVPAQLPEELVQGGEHANRSVKKQFNIKETQMQIFGL